MKLKEVDAKTRYRVGEAVGRCMLVMEQMHMGPAESALVAREVANRVCRSAREDRQAARMAEAIITGAVALLVLAAVLIVRFS